MVLLVLIFGTVAVNEIWAAAEPDLPTRGRSYFDHLVHMMGGVPFPPDKIWNSKAFKELLPGKIILGEQFAHSRSLQKFHISDELPRDLFAFGMKTSTLWGYEPAGRSKIFPTPAGTFQGVPDSGMFVAYSPLAKTLEVASYNPTLGRFEFQIVKNYGPGLKPEVVYAPRALCLSCHQHGIPVFPQAPWSETTGRGEGPFHPSWKSKDGGLKIQRHTLGYDQLVRRTESIAKLQFYWKACDQGHKSPADCRRLMMKAFFQKMDRSKSQDDLKEVQDRFENSLKQSWPKDSRLKSSSLIPNRPPAVTLDELDDKLDPLSPHPEKRLSSAPNAKEIIGDIHDAMEDFGAPHAYEVAKKNSNKMLKALDSNKLNPIFEDEVFNAPEFFRVFLGELGMKVPKSSVLAAREKKMAKPKLDLPTLPRGMKTDSRLNSFKKYCLQCHVAGDAPFAFMRGTDQEILKNIRDPIIQKRIRYRLKAYSKHDMMPPISSDLGKQFLMDKTSYKALLAAVDRIGVEKVSPSEATSKSAKKKTAKKSQDKCFEAYSWME